MVCLNRQVRDELRERYFGTTFELQSDRKYPIIWERDLQDLNFHDETGIESIQDVSNRVLSFLKALDSILLRV